jgi:hypothetical protein
MQDKRSGKDRRTDDGRRKTNAPPPGGKDRRTDEDRRSGKDRRSGSA